LNAISIEPRSMQAIQGDYADTIKTEANA